MQWASASEAPPPCPCPCPFPCLCCFLGLDRLLPSPSSFTEEPVFKEWAPKTPWKGKQILAPLRQRLDFEATDDLELYNEYVESMKQIEAWVKENMADPAKLASMVSA